MAKKKAAAVVVEESSQAVFYADKGKYQRAEAMVKAGKYKTVKDAYTAIGGAFSDHGYAVV
jgi:hypothetical protein